MAIFSCAGNATIGSRTREVTADRERARYLD